MSCSNWDIYCLDCHVDAGMSATNHGLETIRLLIEHREKLEPLERFLAADGVWSMGFAVNGEEVIASFFGEHKGHRLFPRNDSGELDGMCGQSFICPICNTSVACERRDHSIAHAPQHYHFTSNHIVHWELEKEGK
jgi:hypothetical protein